MSFQYSDVSRLRYCGSRQRYCISAIAFELYRHYACASYMCVPACIGTNT